MSNIDINNEFSFGLGLTASQVAQIPKFNIARGKIVPIQLEQPFTEYWNPNNNPNIPDPASGPPNYANYDLRIVNYPTPFFIISSSSVYNNNNVANMQNNDPNTGGDKTLTNLLQFTVVQGDDVNYNQQPSFTEPATLGAGGAGQISRNFYFTPFQGQIMKSMVPVYLLPINTTVLNGANTYLYTFVRADIFITDSSTNGFSYIDYLANPSNYQNLPLPSSLPNYNNLPPTLGNGGGTPIIAVKNLVFLATNYIGNQGSINVHASFNRFLTYDDMYNISQAGANFSLGNSAGPVFFGLEDLQSDGTIADPPPIIPFANPSTFPPRLPGPYSSTYNGYGNNSIQPYYIFSGRPYSIFFGLHLNTNTFNSIDTKYGNTFNNYSNNTLPSSAPPDKSKGFPINFLTSLGNNNPINGVNSSYQKVVNVSSTNTQSFFQPNSSAYIGSTYAMDEYYIANSRTKPLPGTSGASSLYNIYRFSLNKYIRSYSGTDGYLAKPIPYSLPYDPTEVCSYNGGDYNGYKTLLDGSYESDYNLLNCNLIQVGLVQNMTLQFVPMNYFIPPTINSVPNVTDVSMTQSLSGFIPSPTTTAYINNDNTAIDPPPIFTSPNIFIYDSSTNIALRSYTYIKYQIVGGGGGGGGGIANTNGRSGGGGGGSGQILGFVGGNNTSGSDSFKYPQLNLIEKLAKLPKNWKIKITIGAGGAAGVSDTLNPTDGGDGGNTILEILDNDDITYSNVITVVGGGGGKRGYTAEPKGGDAGNGFNGGGGGAGYSGSNGMGGNGIISLGGLSGQTGDNGGNGGGVGFGLRGQGQITDGGGGAAGTAVIYNTNINTGGNGTQDGVPPTAPAIADGIAYTGAGAGGGSYGNSGGINGGVGGSGYAIIQFIIPSDYGFTFPEPTNSEKVYPTTLPTTNSTNVIAPQDLFTTISSLYANSSSVICTTDLSSNSKCGFILPNYYNSLLKRFYTEDPNVLPICGDVYDPPVVVDVPSFYNNSFSNIYNSISCGPYSGFLEQNLCVPNFEYLLNKSSNPPFKCIHLPLPNSDININFAYELYYGMYNADSGLQPINDNLPDYFKQTPDKSVSFTRPAYAPTPYPKPLNVPGSTKTETFWNSTAFIIIAIIIGVAILIAIIIIVVKFTKKPNVYENVRYKYTS
jgi:hypothetical protein